MCQLLCWFVRVRQRQLRARYLGGDLSEVDAPDWSRLHVGSCLVDWLAGVAAAGVAVAAAVKVATTNIAMTTSFAISAINKNNFPQINTRRVGSPPNLHTRPATKSGRLREGGGLRGKDDKETNRGWNTQVHK